MQTGPSEETLAPLRQLSYDLAILGSQCMKAGMDREAWAFLEAGYICLSKLTELRGIGAPPELEGVTQRKREREALFSVMGVR